MLGRKPGAQLANQKKSPPTIGHAPVSFSFTSGTSWPSSRARCIARLLEEWKNGRKEGREKRPVFHPSPDLLSQSILL